MSRAKDIVSGGARGIGCCLVRTLLSAGHNVYILDIDQQELDHTVQENLAEYVRTGRLKWAKCNLRDVDDIRQRVAIAAQFFHHRIDVLINNGSIATPHWKYPKTMEDPVTYTEWQAYLETNRSGPFATSRACIPYTKHTGDRSPTERARKAGPCIIRIGSSRAYQSDPNQEGYAASKAGLLGLMHAVAISLGPLGIRINLGAPVRIKAAPESKREDEDHEKWDGQVGEKDVHDLPANRAGTPEDFADAVVYLMEAGVCHCAESHNGWRGVESKVVSCNKIRRAQIGR